jgi:hypothetical protein
MLSKRQLGAAALRLLQLPSLQQAAEAAHNAVYSVSSWQL